MKGKMLIKFFGAFACVSVFFLGGCSLVDYEVEKEGHVWRFAGLVDDSTALVKVTLEQWGEEHDHHLMGWDDDFHRVTETRYYPVGLGSYRLGKGRDSALDVLPEETSTDKYSLRSVKLDDYYAACGVILLDKNENELDTLEIANSNWYGCDSAKLVGSYVMIGASFYLVKDGKFPRQKPAYRYDYLDMNIKFVDINDDFVMYGGKP